jgi:hypothetical protein
MNDAPARDQREAESPEPDQTLVERRRSRDEQDYREWCELSYGIVKVGEEEFHPADVLDQLAPDAARRGRDEASAQARSDLEQIVTEQFPAPIAVPFYGFLEGTRQPHQRLYRLRDSWESLIRLLAALALAEAARHGEAVAPLVLREGKDQGWRGCKRGDLCSDKLAVRIGLVEGVLHRSKEVGVDLQVASLVPLDVIAEIRRLNVVRNGFSHDTTKSEAQSEAIVDEAYPVLRDVLLDLREMQSIELLRVYSIKPGQQVEVERLVGHSQSRRIQELEVDSEAITVAVSATPVDGMSRVLARVNGLTLDLSPFLYAADDESGHRTRVFHFKRKLGDEWQVECVADSMTLSSATDHHNPLLASFENLLEQGRPGS